MASLDKYDHGGRVRARIEQALASGVAAVKVHEADLGVIEEARSVIPAAIPFVADLNNAHALADIQRDIARWRDRRKYDLIICQGVLQYLPDPDVAPAVANIAAMGRFSSDRTVRDYLERVWSTPDHGSRRF
jgi:hypothetical protein